MTYVFLAGIGNSEPDHWQSLWFRALGGRWVEHADWDRPVAAAWVADLDAVLRETPDPKILVAHSLGCLLAVEWAKRHRGDPDEPVVRGSFLVAPPDPHGTCWPADVITGFAPADADAGKPPLPAIVVASTTDQYASLASARAAAACWDAEFADVGALGHINLASNIGDWQPGRALFDRFVARLQRRP